ncbi:MAG TPA: TIGR03960 family B12-binding radical SAM protein [Candidatus Sumerlaeota bacterium]|nr:TIGR03960 family B12-binding radical SAM protein [Candidatus Sumerlaeota bacterium]
MDLTGEHSGRNTGNRVLDSPEVGCVAPQGTEGRSSLPPEYECLLASVEKPGRYVGGEMNAVAKDPARVRATIALAFPDLYDVGMSYHGFRLLYEIVNARADFAAERVYTPWPDYAEALRRAGLPLTTLETYRPLGSVEVIGFTLQHELGYTNILEMLDLAGIPLLASERESCFPLVIGGGAEAYSPEPLADFFDAFVLGDGEEVLLDLLEVVAQAREEGWERGRLLRTLAGIPGIYVPAFYQVAYREDGAVKSITPVDEGTPSCVEPRIYDISQTLGSVSPVTPLIRTVQNRTVVEIRRGCVNGCRFCQAGVLTRPVRERSIEQVREIVNRSLEQTGDDCVTLLSLSTADYSEIVPLVRTLNRDLGKRQVSVSLPSLRISSFDVALAAEISSVRKSSFTFAPEAGSERLRRIINKPLDEAQFLAIISDVLRAGWKTLKMYFMIGLPGETDEDLDGIVRIVQGALECARNQRVRGLTLNVTLSPFVPKAHTPFQWAGQIDLAEIQRRLRYVRNCLPQKAVAFKTSPVDSSILEAVFARGDRRLGKVLLEAWRNGCRFDAWSELFQPQVWWKAFETCGLDPAWYARRERPDDEVFPYAHLNSAAGGAFLEKQRDFSRIERITPDCVREACAGCAACKPPKQHVLASDAVGLKEVEPLPESVKRVPGKGTSETETPVMRVRLRFSKRGALRFISHLDLAEVIHRLVRMSELPVAYSQGFNPQPRISLSPPLPLGIEGQGELADVYLTERVELKTCLQKLCRVTRVAGLEWCGIEEAPMQSDSLQQSIGEYGYEIAWRRMGEAASVLPTDPLELAAAVQRFLASETWPIELLRKGKLQQRDARAFVRGFSLWNPGADFEAGVALSIKSENGVTLSPLLILESLFGRDLEQGVLLRVSRRPIMI